MSKPRVRVEGGKPNFVRADKAQNAVDKMVKGASPKENGRAHPSSPGGNQYKPKTKESSYAPKEKGKREYGPPIGEKIVD